MKELEVREMEVKILKAMNFKLQIPSISEMAFILVTRCGNQKGHSHLPLDFVSSAINDFVSIGLMQDGCLTANYTELATAVATAILDVWMVPGIRLQVVRSIDTKMALDWVASCLFRIELTFIDKKSSNMLFSLSARSREFRYQQKWKYLFLL